MVKYQNVFEKLQALTENEVKRRSEAIRCLDILTEKLADPISELYDSTIIDYDVMTKAVWIPCFSKEKNKYTYEGTSLYYRFDFHYGTKEKEEPGFYISHEYPFWGKPLYEKKGKEFWQYIKQICDWIGDYLPKYIEQHEKSRNKRLEYLKKVTEYLQQQK